MSAGQYIDIFDTYFGTKPTVLRVDYASDTIWYEGKAESGAATSAARWIIRRSTLDSQGRIVLREWAPFNSVWSDRASLTYQ